MPGAQERVLRNRIGSIKNTKKITRAMELIAATRVVKAQQRANAARPYSEQITAVIENLAAGGASVQHPLLTEATEVTTKGIICIVSDRGLCGAYNTNVIRAAEREVQAARAEGADYRLVLVGKKASDYFKFRGFKIHAEFTEMSDTPTYEDAREVAKCVRDLYDSGEADVVELAYTRFISIGTQLLAVRRFLPLESVESVAQSGGGDAGAVADVEFEPGPEDVLTDLLPRYLEARLYAAMLDAAASEHANRQRAMKSATDNADDDSGGSSDDDGTSGS